jgi:hypothetical protein
MTRDKEVTVSERTVQVRAKTWKPRTREIQTQTQKIEKKERMGGEISTDSFSPVHSLLLLLLF